MVFRIEMPFIKQYKLDLSRLATCMYKLTLFRGVTGISSFTTGPFLLSSPDFELPEETVWSCDSFPIGDRSGNCCMGDWRINEENAGLYCFSLLPPSLGLLRWMAGDWRLWAELNGTRKKLSPLQ